MARKSITHVVGKYTVVDGVRALINDSTELFDDRIKATARLLELRSGLGTEGYQYVMLPYDKKSGGGLFPP